MALFTCLDYVTSQLDGLVCPGLQKPATAVLNPPVAQEAGPGQLYMFVWSDDLVESRQTMGRMTGGLIGTAGFKKLEHVVAVYCLLFVPASDPLGGRKFFQAIDAVQATLRAIPIPVELTDPDTGVTSFLQLIGERFRVKTDVVRATASQRMTRMLAQVTTTVQEQLQS